MKKYFYYLRDIYGLPRVTICLIVIENNNSPRTICRGMAVCSKSDQPMKKFGNIISSGRAFKSYIKKVDRGPIKRFEAYNAIRLLPDENIRKLPPIDVQLMKGYFDPKLTEYEKQLIEEVNHKGDDDHGN